MDELREKLAELFYDEKASWVIDACKLSVDDLHDDRTSVSRGWGSSLDCEKEPFFQLANKALALMGGEDTSWQAAAVRLRATILLHCKRVHHSSASYLHQALDETSWMEDETLCGEPKEPDDYPVWKFVANGLPPVGSIVWVWSEELGQSLRKYEGLDGNGKPKWGRVNGATFTRGVFTYWSDYGVPRPPE